MPKRVSYTSAFKLKVVSVAQEKGNRAAARHFDINESCIRLWRKQAPQLQQMPRSKRANRGSKAHFPELEQSLLNFIKDHQAAGIPLSTIHIRLKAKSLAKQMKIPTSDFLASPNWAYRFMARHNLSIRRCTTIAQKLPEDF